MIRFTVYAGRADEQTMTFDVVALDHEDALRMVGDAFRSAHKKPERILVSVPNTAQLLRQSL